MKKTRALPLSLALVLSFATAEASGSALPRDPDMTLRIASFTALEDIVGAVANALGQPMIGISVPAMARAQLVQLGSGFDFEKPWQIALWFEKPEITAKPAENGDGDDADEDQAFDINDLVKAPPVAAVVAKIPLANANLDALGIPPPERLAEKGIAIVAGPDALTAAVNLSKAFASDGNPAFTFPGFAECGTDALAAAAEPKFAEPPFAPDAAIESIVFAPKRYADAIKPTVADSDVADEFRKIGIENPQAILEAYWNIAYGKLSGASRIVQDLTLQSDTAFSAVTRMEVEPGSPLEKQFAAYATLDAATVAAIPDAPFFLASSANPIESKSMAECYRIAGLPLIKAVAKTALDQCCADGNEAKKDAFRNALALISNALVGVLDTATGATSMRLGQDAAGHLAAEASIDIGQAEAAKPLLAGIRAATQTAFDAAVAEDADFPKDLFSLSDAADTGTFLISVSSEALAKKISEESNDGEGEDGNASETLALFQAAVGNGVETGYVIEEKGGSATLKATFGSIGASFAGLPPADGAALLSTLPQDARPYLAGAFSLSQFFRQFFSMGANAGIVEPEQERMFDEAAAVAPASSRIGFACGVFPTASVSVVTVPLSEIAFLAKVATLSSAFGPDDSDEDEIIGFDDEEEDDDNGED